MRCRSSQGGEGAGRGQVGSPQVRSGVLRFRANPPFGVPPPACLQAPYLFSTYYARGTELGCGDSEASP